MIPFAVISELPQSIPHQICSPVSIQEKWEKVNCSNFTDYLKPVSLDPYEAVVRRINSFSGLKENWDGYSATRLNPKVLANSITFLKKLNAATIEIVEEEDITPTPYGTVVIDFCRGASLVSVEIGNNTIGFFADFESGTSQEIESRIFNQDSIPNEIFEALSQLYS